MMVMAAVLLARRSTEYLSVGLPMSKVLESAAYLLYLALIRFGVQIKSLVTFQSSLISMWLVTNLLITSNMQGME